MRLRPFLAYGGSMPPAIAPSRPVLRPEHDLLEGEVRDDQYGEDDPPPLVRNTFELRCEAVECAVRVAGDELVVVQGEERGQPGEKRHRQHQPDEPQEGRDRPDDALRGAADDRAVELLSADQLRSEEHTSELQSLM